MPDKKNIAGVVLAGGQSSRMGQSKALLDYNGQPLLDYMIALLKQSGLNDVYVSGDLEGYRCIPDRAPYNGPAHAIADVLAELHKYNGTLFVPVDMPLLKAEALRLLIQQERSSYFEGFPLPAFVTRPHPEERAPSVKIFLKAAKACPISLPSALSHGMRNTNTPEEWKEALRA